MGYGGFGIVVAAKDKVENKWVALKIVDKTERGTAHHSRMLQYEYSVLVNLDHENIIKVLYLFH